MVLQWVGIVLFLSSCCIGSTAGLWDPVWSRARTWQELEKNPSPDVTLGQLVHDPPKAAVALMVGFVPIGGLALAVFGLGLQADKPRAAWGAVLANTGLFVVLLVAGVALWIAEGPAMLRAWHALLTLLTAALFIFTFKALGQVRADPPPRTIESFHIEAPGRNNPVDR